MKKLPSYWLRFSFVFTTLLAVLYAPVGHPYQVQAKTDYSPRYTLELSPLDGLGRAGMAHIRLKESEQPDWKRSERLTYNPAG
ncbi:hypothetical protein ACVR1I_04095 [Streptococcus cameli]